MLAHSAQCSLASPEGHYGHLGDTTAWTATI